MKTILLLILASSLSCGPITPSTELIKIKPGHPAGSTAIDRRFLLSSLSLEEISQVKKKIEQGLAPQPSDCMELQTNGDNFIFLWNCVDQPEYVPSLKTHVRRRWTGKEKYIVKKMEDQSISIDMKSINYKMKIERSDGKYTYATFYLNRQLHALVQGNDVLLNEHKFEMIPAQSKNEENLFESSFNTPMRFHISENKIIQLGRGSQLSSRYRFAFPKRKIEATLELMARETIGLTDCNQFVGNIEFEYGETPGHRKEGRIASNGKVLKDSVSGKSIPTKKCLKAKQQ